MKISEIELNKSEKRLLETINKSTIGVNESLSNWEPGVSLSAKGLIYFDIKDEKSGTLTIHQNGKDWLEFHAHNSRNKFLEDLRGWITTLIAIAALLKSFSTEINGFIKWILKI